jgi:hypothetical protein
MPTVFEVISGTSSSDLHANIMAKKGTEGVDDFHLIGFACKSDGSIFYALVTYTQ